MVTVQFIQLDKVPAFEVALIEKRYVPTAPAVPDTVVPDQVTPYGWETRVRVADSFTVGVYE